MEVDEAKEEIRQFVNEIAQFLKTKAYSLSGYSGGRSIGSVRQEFRVQTKEIDFQLKKKLKNLSRSKSQIIRIIKIKKTL